MITYPFTHTLSNGMIVEIDAQKTLIKLGIDPVTGLQHQFRFDFLAINDSKGEIKTIHYIEYISPNGKVIPEMSKRIDPPPAMEALFNEFSEKFKNIRCHIVNNILEALGAPTLFDPNTYEVISETTTTNTGTF